MKCIKVRGKCQHRQQEDRVPDTKDTGTGFENERGYRLFVPYRSRHFLIHMHSEEGDGNYELRGGFDQCVRRSREDRAGASSQPHLSDTGVHGPGVKTR
ncbi:hypothetical protein BaRGS_00007871 [Batillaria attramentaria]|uniref:Uncharacterized protein n=1 Tax=Batillaria attramentaria TaxID=370345 RepID=A0ABD0LP21_9CAEN